jgi:hypothetical protein
MNTVVIGVVQPGEFFSALLSAPGQEGALAPSLEQCSQNID